MTTNKEAFTLEYFVKRINGIASAARIKIDDAFEKTFPLGEDEDGSIPYGDISRFTKLFNEGKIVFTGGRAYSDLCNVFEYAEVKNPDRVRGSEIMNELKFKVSEQADKVKDLGVLTDVDLLTKINDFEAWTHSLEIKF